MRARFSPSARTVLHMYASAAYVSRRGQLRRPPASSRLRGRVTVRRHVVRLHRVEVAIRRRPANLPGDVLRCLLLARGPEWVVVDVATGALVRSRASGWPVVATDSSLVSHQHLGADRDGSYSGPELDVVEIELADDDEPSDPARPEAVMVRRAPERVGIPRRRAVRRILHELLPADPKRPLLGSLGPSISYVDLDGSRPSVAVVAPDRAPAFASDTAGTWCHLASEAASTVCR